MIYDITKELISAEVYPGDPVPKIEKLRTVDETVFGTCQLSRLVMGSHSGTHLDAPAHFIADGKDAAAVSLGKCVGKCKVITYSGKPDRKLVDDWLRDGTDKLLVHGNIEIDEELAKSMIQRGINCIGVEMTTIASGDQQGIVHTLLLEAEVVILESLVLKEVPDGTYFLCALPLKIEGADGSPVRAVLVPEME